MAAPALQAHRYQLRHFQRPGSPVGRPAVAEPLGDADIHERAFCESGDVGPGVVIEAGAYVGAGAVLGAGCRVRECACVGGILGEGVEVGRGALIGAGVRVGEGAIILAGSVVLADVAPHQVVDGDPARPVR